MLASIQLIVHLPLFSVAFPPNARYIFSMVIDLANFKIIPVDWIVDNVLGIKKAVSSNSSASEFGYSSNLFKSLGLIFFFVVGAIVTLIICYFLWKFCNKIPFVRKVLTFIKNKLIFNTFIRTFIQGFMGFALSSFFSIQVISFANSGQSS